MTEKSILAQGSEGFDEALERAARAVHESESGKGSWVDAPTPIRSKRRHQVRLVLSTLEKNGFPVQGAIAAPTPPLSKPADAPALRSRRAATKSY